MRGESAVKVLSAFSTSSTTLLWFRYYKEDVTNEHILLRGSPIRATAEAPTFEITNFYFLPRGQSLRNAIDLLFLVVGVEGKLLWNGTVAAEKSGKVAGEGRRGALVQLVAIKEQVVVVPGTWGERCI